MGGGAFRYVKKHREPHETTFIFENKEVRLKKDRNYSACEF
jgi:hypothetical protein